MSDKNKKKEKEKEKEKELIDDVEFEELNAEGEVMSEKEKEKNNKNKLEKKYLEKIERLERERDEYLQGWQRVQADYKNREKELEEYKKTFVNFANENLIKNILPVLDGYDMAKMNKEIWEKVDENWRIGVEYLFSQLLNILTANGLIAFGEVGENCDVNFHEVIEIVKLNVEEKDKHDKIVNVIQRGYKIGNKILRVAKVKVGRFE